MAMPFSAVLLCLTLVSHAASSQTNATSRPSNPSPAVPDALSATQEMPKSVFVVPAAATEGKDPFFPRSTRPYSSIAPNITTNQPQSLTADLFVAGFSGLAERPLAIINTTTFGVGDENDVIAKGRRVRVRCLEINMQTGTVIIQVGSERKVLRFKQSK